MVQESAASDEVLLFFLKYVLAFGLRGDVRMVGSGSANGTKHLSREGQVKGYHGDLPWTIRPCVHAYAPRERRHIRQSYMYGVRVIKPY